MAFYLKGGTALGDFPEALSLREVPIVENAVLKSVAIQIKNSNTVYLSLFCQFPVPCGQKHTQGEGSYVKG